jgi:hypothetical protein
VSVEDGPAQRGPVLGQRAITASGDHPSPIRVSLPPCKRHCCGLDPALSRPREGGGAHCIARCSSGWTPSRPFGAETVGIGRYRAAPPGLPRQALIQANPAWPAGLARRSRKSRALHGKEGVRGSSPRVGSRKPLHFAGFCVLAQRVEAFAIREGVRGSSPGSPLRKDLQIRQSARPARYARRGREGSWGRNWGQGEPNQSGQGECQAARLPAPGGDVWLTRRVMTL